MAGAGNTVVRDGKRVRRAPGFLVGRRAAISAELFVAMMLLVLFLMGLLGILKNRTDGTQGTNGTYVEVRK